MTYPLKGMVMEIEDYGAHAIIYLTSGAKWAVEVDDISLIESMPRFKSVTVYLRYHGVSLYKISAVHLGHNVFNWTVSQRAEFRMYGQARRLYSGTCSLSELGPALQLKIDKFLSNRNALTEEAPRVSG
jgi:hypothetical protein